MKGNNKKAFTLIELLVVITIIGILATGGVAVYTTQIQKARDSVRIKDIAALDSAVNQYYQDESVYPGKDTNNDNLQSKTIIGKYIGNAVQDAKNSQNCSGTTTTAAKCGYIFASGTDANGITGGGYELSTAFENEGNVSTKASNANDGGNDETRYEVGNGVQGNYDIKASTDIPTVAYTPKTNATEIEYQVNVTKPTGTI